MARIDVLLGKQTRFTGIEFVRVIDSCEQKRLRLYFLTDITKLATDFRFVAPNALDERSIVIHADTDPGLLPVPVATIFRRLITDPNDPLSGQEDQAQFDADLQRSYLELEVVQPGGFALYRLRIDDPLASTSVPSRIDPAFNDVRFSFKVGCDDGHDCAPPPLNCPEEPQHDFPVDYLARDFVSFRNALLDFAAQRYPDWSLPIEADAGVMLAEVFAAMGDEFAYMQERYAREAFLETANQRRSLRKKARLLDYEIHDGRSPSALIECVVTGAGSIDLSNTNENRPPPPALTVESDDGHQILFEFGLGLSDHNLYPLNQAWNRGELKPYAYEVDDPACLPVGATSLLVQGSIPDHAALVSSDPPRYLLVQSIPEHKSERTRIQFVRVNAFEAVRDAVAEVNLTRIHWDAEDALEFEVKPHPTRLELSLNIVPATAGQTFVERFHIGPDPDFVLEPSVERESGVRDADNAPRTYHLHGLNQTAELGLGFLGATLRGTNPEIELTDAAGTPWTYQRTLLSADEDSTMYTIEDGTWRAIRRFWTPDGMLVHRDYASGKGYSLRFGEGVFGRVPSGMFTVRYRTGPGTKANVPASTLTIPDATRTALATQSAHAGETLVIVRVTNPLAANNGVDPESQREIKLLVPEAYQHDVYFAVRPEEYGQQAERLSFVQRAQATQRWTGSWLSNFVAADPYDTSVLTTDEFDHLEAWMNCVRQAGRDVIVKNPRTLAIDLRITLCVEPNTYADHVVAQLYEVLMGPGTNRRLKGFFHPDHFTFGTPLYRSALEAAIQRVPGVKAVRRMQIRERGLREFDEFSKLALIPGADQVIRLDNDPGRPENGTLRVLTEGGA